MIYGSPPRFTSARDNIRKYVDIANYFTIATTSYKNSFQCVEVPFIELINDNALSVHKKHHLKRKFCEERFQETNQIKV